MLYLSLFGVKFVHSLWSAETVGEECLRSHILFVLFWIRPLSEVQPIRRLQTLFVVRENSKRTVLAFPSSRLKESNH